MPTSTPHLTGLPIEILEQIVLCLTTQDTINMDVVRLRLATNSTRFRIDFKPQYSVPVRSRASGSEPE